MTTAPRSHPPGLARACSLSSPGPYDASRSLGPVPTLTIVVVDFEIPFTSPLPRSRLLSSCQIICTPRSLVPSKADTGLGAWLWCYSHASNIAVLLSGLDYCYAFVVPCRLTCSHSRLLLTKVTLVSLDMLTIRTTYSPTSTIREQRSLVQWSPKSKFCLGCH